jgi:DNA-binding protein H-NS
MNRATWLQGRRMLKFRDVLSRWERRELSMMEAGELLGMSERQFRRYRDRFEEDGEAGLIDRRLGKPSDKRIATVEIDRMLELYRTVYRGWNVTHFHEHGVRDHKFTWGYTWTKMQLHTAGLVERAKRRGAYRRNRERKPCEGMMLHQDGSQHVWLSKLGGSTAGGRPGRRVSAMKGRKVPPKYRSKQNPKLTWAGRGATPRWIRDEMKKRSAPENATIGQMTAVVVRWVEQRPERWYENFLALTLFALHDAWPCPKDRP